MNRTVVDRLFAGAYANTFAQFVNIITHLGVPLLLYCWGVDLYGEWLVLSAIPFYLSLGDVSFASVAANEMTMQVARGDRRSALATFQSVLILIATISVLLFLSLLAARYFPFDSWFNFSLLQPADVADVILILGCHVLLGFQLSLLEAGFRCDGNYAKGTSLLAVLRLTEFLGLFATAYLGGGVVGAATAFLCIRAIGVIGLRFILKRNSPWITYGCKFATTNNIRKLASPALSYMALPLGNALSIQGMVLLIGAFLGPASVVVFSVTRTISRIALQAMGLIKSTVWPELSAAFGKGDIDLARNLHRLSCQLSFWVSTSVIGVLLITGAGLIEIWTNGKVHVDYNLFSLMLVVMFANSFWYTSSVVHVAINKHEIMAGLYLTGTGGSLLLAAYLLPKFSLIGAAIALLLVDFLMILYVVRISILLTDDKLRGFLKQLFSFSEMIKFFRRAP